MPLSNQIDVFDLRNVDWTHIRFVHSRIEELKEVEKANKEHVKRSWGVKESWNKRKQK